MASSSLWQVPARSLRCISRGCLRAPSTSSIAPVTLLRPLRHSSSSSSPSASHATHPVPVPGPVCVRASIEERTRGRLSEQNLEIAVRQVRHDGLVVVENAIDDTGNILDQLNGKMVADALELRSRGDDSPFNYNQGNLQQDAPPVKEFFHPAIFLNPIATQITSAVLGPRPKLTFCSGNSAMPATTQYPPARQPVHSDADFAHPDHPFALVVNIPLIDMKPENGSTEIWLGTHSESCGGIEAQEGAHGDRASGRIRAALVEERSKTRPPVQPFVPKGSVVIRDLRLWHAGMPNYSGDVRIMLAMIHFAPWYRNQMKMELSEEIEPLVTGLTDLDVRATFVSEEAALRTYLNRGFGNSYDFGQTL